MAAQIAIPAILGAIAILASASGQAKQQKFLEKEAKKREKEARRAAIQRAMGAGFGPRPRITEPPNLTGTSIVSGLANVGAQTTARPEFWEMFNKSGS